MVVIELKRTHDGGHMELQAMLNRFPGMDIHCVRLIPYGIDGKVLLDIQQVLPLPEAVDYQIQLRRKDVAGERARTRGHDYTRYHIVVNDVALLDENKRNAIRVMVEQLAARGVPLDDISKALPDGPGRRMRALAGRYMGGDAVREAFRAADPKVDVRRWFCDHAHVDEGAGLTYVLINQWGTNTEPALAALAAAFPDAKVTYRRAESDRLDAPSGLRQVTDEHR